MGTIRSFAVVLVACLATVAGCQKPTASEHGKSEPPAKVQQPGDEQSLNTITLTTKAEQRLGIETVELQMVDLQRRRTFGGEVVVPPGRTIVVSAPIAGTLAAPGESSIPMPGSKLDAGQPVFDFLPMLSPERGVLTPAERIGVAQTRADLATAEVEAERQIESATVQLEAAQIAYDRAVKLLESKAGSKRSVDEADANLRLAREALVTAQARHELLRDIRLDEDPGELELMTIKSPIAGVLQSLSVAPGEVVATGQPLFDVVTVKHVWIRVPVYVGHRREIDTALPASVAEYGRSSDAMAQPATYVAAPPSANSAATSIDVFYELDNPEGTFYPGQKLAVTVPMQNSKQSLVVPWAAILYDIHGGTWVYERIAPQIYTRRRVAVQYIDKPNAILSAGPEPGSHVVTAGAVELFGTEFGVGK